MAALFRIKTLGFPYLEFGGLPLVKSALQKVNKISLFPFFLSNKTADLNRTVSTKRVGTDSSKFCPFAGTENSTQWYSQYHGQVTSLPLSGSDTKTMYEKK